MHMHAVSPVQLIPGHFPLWGPRQYGWHSIKGGWGLLGSAAPQCRNPQGLNDLCSLLTSDLPQSPGLQLPVLTAHSAHVSCNPVLYLLWGKKIHPFPTLWTPTVDFQLLVSLVTKITLTVKSLLCTLPQKVIKAGSKPTRKISISLHQSPAASRFLPKHLPSSTP